MQLRKRKRIKPGARAASARPGGPVILNPPKEKFNWKDYKWKQLFSQLQPAI